MLLSLPLRLTGVVLVAVAAVACGRSDPFGFGRGPPLDSGPPPDGLACESDRDCPFDDACARRRCEAGRCVALPIVVCEDGDECTNDLCDPSTGACVFEPATRDEDGDGFRSPKPGFAPGAPGACGDDCDDTSAAAFPGGAERCDGVDNDCNGIVDDDAEFIPVTTSPVLVSDGPRQASAGGIAFGSGYYAALYAAHWDSWENTFEGLDRAGRTLLDQTPITEVTNDSYSGPIIWTGSTFGVVWEDRRDSDFEIYFNRLDEDGNKLGPDVRVSEAEGFSLRGDMIWNGTEFVVVWEDERNGRGDYRIYGQRISATGELLGTNVELTPPGLSAEGPSLAEGATSLGLVFNVDDSGARRVAFRWLAPDLSDTGDVVLVGQEDSVKASIVWNADRYVVGWHIRDVVPGDAIYGASLTERGSMIAAARRITAPAAFARSHTLMPLGDRMLLLWAEYSGGSYDVHSKLISSGFDDVTPPRRVTSSPADALGPGAAFGPDGDVGILFNDQRSGDTQVYFTRLSCSAS